MQEFDEFQQRIDVIRAEAADRAAQLIRAELVAIHKEFPKHVFEFYTGAYAPYVRVSPPLHGVTDIHEFDIENGLNSALKHVAGQRKMQVLRSHIDRMSKIAVLTEDTFRHDLQYITLDDGPDIRAAAERDDEPQAPSPGM